MSDQQKCPQCGIECEHLSSGRTRCPQCGLGVTVRRWQTSYVGSDRGLLSLAEREESIQWDEQPVSADDILTALDWMDCDQSTAVHIRNRVVSRDGIDAWADGHQWEATIVDGQAAVTRDDGVSATVWCDSDGVLQAVEV